MSDLVIVMVMCCLIETDWCRWEWSHLYIVSANKTCSSSKGNKSLVGSCAAQNTSSNSVRAFFVLSQYLYRTITKVITVEIHLQVRETPDNHIRMRATRHSASKHCGSKGATSWNVEYHCLQMWLVPSFVPSSPRDKSKPARGCSIVIKCIQIVCGGRNQPVKMTDGVREVNHSEVSENRNFAELWLNW